MHTHMHMYTCTRACMHTSNASLHQLIPDFSSALNDVAQVLHDALDFNLSSSVNLSFLDTLLPFNTSSYRFNVLQFNLTDVQVNLTNLITELQNNSVWP